MITGVLEHCDEKGMEPCHDTVQGAYRQQVSGSIVMKSVLSIVMTKVMEHSEDDRHGAL